MGAGFTGCGGTGSITGCCGFCDYLVAIVVIVGVVVFVDCLVQDVVVVFLPDPLLPFSSISTNSTSFYLCICLLFLLCSWILSNPFISLLISLWDTVNASTFSISINCQYSSFACIINVYIKRLVFSSTCEISQHFTMEEIPCKPPLLCNSLHGTLMAGTGMNGIHKWSWFLWV